MGLKAPISVDTYKSEVAADALEHGAAMINDVSALRFDASLAGVVARAEAALVLMHMRENPEVMQQIEPSLDIFADIEAELSAAVNKALGAGIGRDQIVLDPGIGFGKTLDQNLAIINRLDRFRELGFPLMIGTSRKSFIGKITGRPASDRLFGTAASVAAAVLRGAHMIRVHDVREMVEVARIVDAIAAEQVIVA
jgi:dihydropteroate synthase